MKYMYMYMYEFGSFERLSYLFLKIFADISIKNTQFCPKIWSKFGSGSLNLRIAKKNPKMKFFKLHKLKLKVDNLFKNVWLKKIHS